MASCVPPTMNGIDSRNLPPLVWRVVARYVRAFAPERIVLFGSYAKGTHSPNSDVDLLIVADLVGDLLFHLRRARQLSLDCFPRVDVVFATRDDINGAANARSPFLLSILQSGFAIYGLGVRGNSYLV